MLEVYRNLLHLERVGVNTVEFWSDRKGHSLMQHLIISSVEGKARLHNVIKSSWKNHML